MTRTTFIDTVLPLRDRCYRLAASLLRNGPESEDVAQDVMMRLWARRSRLSEIDNLEAFALRAARNAALDRKRHSSWRTGDVDALYNHASRELAPDARAEQHEAVEAVLDCMAGLPETQRSILHLREVEQMSYDEIGATLDLTAAQVKVYLHRARKRVRAAVDPSHAPGADGSPLPHPGGAAQKTNS